MVILCKVCSSRSCVKAGFIRKKQRYKCNTCKLFFTMGDGRVHHEVSIKRLAVRMYVNNCGFRRISEILEVPLTTVFQWIRQAGTIVDAMVKSGYDDAENIEILEMDELYTYVQKNPDLIGKQGKKQGNTPEFGLLLIGKEAKWLRLR
jgi:transposase